MIIYDPKIAILLIAFNRSNIKQVFDRIKVVKPRRLYIAVDESTNDTQCKICKETTSIVSHIDWECQVFKLYQEKNQGYDKHCFHSISWFFEQEPEGIILEDDCVPSLSFFGYCTTLLKNSETTNASDIYPEVIINSVKTGETELTIILT